MNEVYSPNEHIEEINEGLKLITRCGGLTFGTDSFLLSAFLKKNLRGSAADLGSGTGIISLYAAQKCSFDSITAFEIQPYFARLTERNGELNGYDKKIKAVCDDVRNVLDHEEGGTFSAVFSNPPYMKSGSGKAPSTDIMNFARREENGTVEDFVIAASKLLKHGGLFYTVFRPERMAELFYALKKHFLEPKKLVTVHSDIESAPSLILTEAKKGASESLKISRPLIVYSDTNKTDNRKYTEDMARVYNEFTLDFLF